MVGVLARPQTEGERFMGSLEKAGPQLHDAFSAAMKPMKEDQENESLKRLTGKDFSGVSPELKKTMIDKLLSAKETPSSSGDTLNALNSIQELVGQKGIGMLGSLNQTGEARFNRGKFQSLQAKLMPLFKGMFPRGMTEKEFAFINKNYVPQPHDSEETIKGKLAGLRELLGTVGESGMAQPAMEEMQGESNFSSQNGKQKFDIINPKHKARRDQVLKKTKNDRKKAEKILQAEFDL